MEIKIQQVGMTYPSGKQALKQLNLELRSPSLIGLLGPNGAGKSTLMKLLVAALLPTEGTHPGGRSAAAPGRAHLKAELGYLPQDFGLFDELTVTQFLDYMAALKGSANPQSRHSGDHPGGQSGGEGEGQDPHPVRRPAPAGGNRPGPAGRPTLPDF